MAYTLKTNNKYQKAKKKRKFKLNKKSIHKKRSATLHRENTKEKQWTMLKGVEAQLYKL